MQQVYVPPKHEPSMIAMEEHKQEPHEFKIIELEVDLDVAQVFSPRQMSALILVLIRIPNSGRLLSQSQRISHSKNQSRRRVGTDRRL